MYYHLETVHRVVYVATDAVKLGILAAALAILASSGPQLAHRLLSSPVERICYVYPSFSPTTALEIPCEQGARDSMPR